MRIPSEKVSAEVIRGLSRYSIARLKSDVRVAGLVEGLSKARDAVLTATSTRATTRDAALDAMAARDAADRALDQLLVKMSLTLLAAVGNRRDDPQYRRLFPGGANAITQLPLVDEISAVKLLQGRLAEEATSSAAAAFKEDLTAATAALESALATYGAALLADQTARAHEIEARQDWRRVYQKLYAEVLVAVNGQRAEAESFFRASSSASGDTDVPEPTPPVA